MADLLAIRELVDAYAHCADRRDAEGQKALFTEDTHFVVYMDGQGVNAFGAVWWAVSPAGNQVTTKPSSGNTGGY